MPRNSQCPVCRNPLVVVLRKNQTELEALNDELADKAAVILAEAELGVKKRRLGEKILEPGGDEAYLRFPTRVDELKPIHIRDCCKETLAAFCIWNAERERNSKIPSLLGMRLLFKRDPWPPMRGASIVRVLSSRVRDGFFTDTIPTLESHAAKSLVRAMFRCFLLEHPYDATIPAGWTFDFTPWDSLDLCAAYLVADNYGIPVGCASFVKRPGRARWMLGWAWFRPEARRKGHLARHWLQLRAVHGDFVLSQPLSEGMTAFLAHEDPSALPVEAWT